MLLHTKNNPRPLLRSRSGFTFVELVVSVGIFAIVMAVASGSFIQALRGQRQLAGLMAAQGNASLVIEQMTREIRTGSRFCLGPFSGFDQTGGSVADNSDPDTFRCNPGFGFSQPIEKLVFLNAQLQKVMYRLDGDHITRRVFDQTDGDLGAHVITANNVSVSRLSFAIENGTNDYQPRVTLALEVRPKEATARFSATRIQTTVSSRQP